MKKTILAALLLCAASVTCAQSVEYLRPTADTDSTNTALRTAACGASGTDIGSISNSGAYSGKSTAPPTGSNVNQGTSSSTTLSFYTMRVFSAWQTTSNTYSSLTVSLNSMCSISDTGDDVGGRCGAAYSTNGGSTWISLYSYASLSTNSDSQAIHTATITGASLSNLQVGVCALAKLSPNNSSEATIYFNDIWTAGTYGSSGHVIPPQIISKLHNTVRGYSR